MSHQRNEAKRNWTVCDSLKQWELSVIIGISIFQIVQKENEYAADEIQPVAIEESGFESDSSISAENDFINDKKVSTHKSLFAIDLLGDFIVLNIPTILCTLDIAKKKKN